MAPDDPEMAPDDPCDDSQGITKGYLRAAGLGIRSSFVLLPLIFCSLYIFAVLGIEMFGCLEGVLRGGPTRPPMARDGRWRVITIAP